MAFFFVAEEGLFCSILKAVSRTSMKTFGQRMLKLDPGLRRSFPHVFIAADILHHTIGADFLKRFNLSLSARRGCLTDDSIGLSVTDNTIPCISRQCCVDIKCRTHTTNCCIKTRFSVRHQHLYNVNFTWTLTQYK